METAALQISASWEVFYQHGWKLGAVRKKDWKAGQSDVGQAAEIAHADGAAKSAIPHVGHKRCLKHASCGNGMGLVCGLGVESGQLTKYIRP